VALPGAHAPTSIALRVIGTPKFPLQDIAVALDEAIYYYDVKINEDEMGGQYSTHRRGDNCAHNFRKLEGFRTGLRGGLFSTGQLA
jgi:hypothetical protein